MNVFNVLITGAGTTNAINVLKSLKAANDPSIKLFMGDIDPDCAGAYLADKYICMPLATDPDFENLVIDICQKYTINLVIPIIDYEFRAWAAVSLKLLNLGTRVVISRPDVIALCEEKDQTIKYFEKIGVPCPETWRISELKDLSKLPFPLFIKPRCGRASIDNYVAHNLKEFLFFSSQKKDLVAQPLLHGDEVTIDTLSDFNGRFLGACPRIRVEVKSGQAFKSLTIDAPELVEYSKKIVEGLPIIGSANIQCFLTVQGPKFFEINPRFGAGSILSIESGLKGPEALVAMAKGQPIPKITPRPKVQMLRYWQEVFVERNGYPIFFDLDGPILDVSKRHYEVYRSIIKEEGGHALPFNQYWKMKRSRQPHDKIVTNIEGMDFYINSFIPKWFNRIENEDYLELDRVWPWVIDVLSELYQKHELYIVTVRCKVENLRKQLDRLNLTRWFQEILCGPAKRNAGKQKVKTIRDHFTTLNPKAIIVGDTEADIECGKELGYITVGVLCGIRNRENLQETKCDYLIEDIKSLPKLVNQL